MGRVHQHWARSMWINWLVGRMGEWERVARKTDDNKATKQPERSPGLVTTTCHAPPHLALCNHRTGKVSLYGRMEASC